MTVIGLNTGFLYVQDNPKVDAVFQGIRPVVVVLITYVGYKIGQITIYDKTAIVTMIFTVCVLLFLHTSRADYFVWYFNWSYTFKTKEALDMTVKK